MSSAPLPIDVTLARTLREFRHRKGLTQQQLARRLRVPVRSLQAYESGAMPQPKRRQRIVAFLEREAAKESGGAT